MLWAMLAPASHGLALIREGRAAEGIVPLKASIQAWEATGGRSRNPSRKAYLAEAMALTGDLDNALQLIDEAISQIERPGWEERLSYAEILRLKGWMLSLKGDLEGAERNFLTSLNWSRRQQAKSGSSARQPAWHDCGRARANARTRMTCLPRFTIGSPKVSTPRICKRQSTLLDEIAMRLTPKFGTLSSRDRRGTAPSGNGCSRLLTDVWRHHRTLRPSSGKAESAMVL